MSELSLHSCSHAKFCYFLFSSTWSFIFIFLRNIRHHESPGVDILLQLRFRMSLKYEELLFRSQSSTSEHIQGPREMSRGIAQVSIHNWLDSSSQKCGVLLCLHWLKVTLPTSTVVRFIRIKRILELPKFLRSHHCVYNRSRANKFSIIYCILKS